MPYLDEQLDCITAAVICGAGVIAREWCHATLLCYMVQFLREIGVPRAE